MQKLVAFVATVAVVCVAFVQGQQTTVTLPGFTRTYPIPQAEQTACATHAAAFQTAWTVPASGPANACNTDAARRPVWQVYREGLVLVIAAPDAFDIQDTTDMTDCMAKASVLTAGNSPALGPRENAQGACTYLNAVVEACACARMKCVTDAVNAAVTSATCNPFAQGVCSFFTRSAANPDADSINANCAALVNGAQPGTGFGAWTPGTLPTACPATGHCLAATVGVSSTVPPTNTTTRPSTTSGASLVSSGVYLAAVALGAAAVL